MTLKNLFPLDVSREFTLVLLKQEDTNIISSGCCIWNPVSKLQLSELWFDFSGHKISLLLFFFFLVSEVRKTSSTVRPNCLVRIRYLWALNYRKKRCSLENNTPDVCGCVQSLKTSCFSYCFCLSLICCFLMILIQ